MTKSRQSALNGTPLTVSEKLPNGFSDITTESATDLTRWRLLNERGRQTWHYLTTDEQIQAWPQSIADKQFLGLQLVSFYPSLGLLLADADADAKLTWAAVGSSGLSPGPDSIGSREERDVFYGSSSAPTG